VEPSELLTRGFSGWIDDVEFGPMEEVADIYQQELITRIPTGFFSYQMRSGTSVAPDYGVPQRPNSRQFVGYDWSNGRLVHSARNPTDGNKLAWVSLGTWTANWRAGDVVAVGNVDDDSAVVRFTGEHELLYAEPEMLVAMAPPPFFRPGRRLLDRVSLLRDWLVSWSGLERRACRQGRTVSLPRRPWLLARGLHRRWQRFMHHVLAGQARPGQARPALPPRFASLAGDRRVAAPFRCGPLVLAKGHFA
jgi:hypothetical protein